MNKASIVFRVDGGSLYSIAMGHVYRCLKVARYIRRHTAQEAVFLMKDYEQGVSRVMADGFRVVCIPPDSTVTQDVELTSQACEGRIVFIDVRHYSPRDVKILRVVASRTVLFDDLGGKSFRPDILINPAVLPRHVDYPELFADTVYCLGPRYFILGESAARPRQKVSTNVRRIMVSLGGADPAGYTLDLLGKLHDLAEDFYFTFVLGPAYADTRLFIETLKKKGLAKRITVRHVVEDLPLLMCRHDLGIVAGGDTCLELAWTGTPGMIAPTISYEAETAAYLEKRGVFVNLGDLKHLAGEQIAATVRAFTADHEKRKQYAANGRELIDGCGMERICKMIGDI